MMSHENKLCSSLFVGFHGKTAEPHAAQPHYGLHRVQMALTGQEAGERLMLAMCVLRGWALLLFEIEISLTETVGNRIFKV